jgi:hypothetical protein
MGASDETNGERRWRLRGAKRIPVLRASLSEAQAEAGPLMPMIMRRADMAAL